jgi:hypothetical protein
MDRTLDSARSEIVRLLCRRRYGLIYRAIFGSQIALVRILNTRPSIDESVVREYFDVIRSRSPDFYAGMPFGQWFGYLKAVELLGEDGGKIAITSQGRDFLVYLTGSGLPVNKLF